MKFFRNVITSRVSILVCSTWTNLAYCVRHSRSYCLLLKRLQFNCTTWVQFLTLVTTVGGEHTEPVKNMNMSLHGPSTIHLLLFFVYNTPEVKFVRNTKHIGHNTHKTRVHLIPFVFSNGIHRLLDTNKKGKAFPSQSNCQDQLQTRKSASVRAKVSWF